MKGEDYVKIIVEDELDRIAWEDTVVQEQFYIRREYEIDDGAVIEYEWRAFPGDSADQRFNHRFTMKILPKRNTEKLELGVLKTIQHPANGR
jgi:hypothetical protein